jgi:hypothetical protein
MTAVAVPLWPIVFRPAIVIVTELCGELTTPSGER